MKSNRKTTVFDVTLVALMVAVIEVFKFAMMGIPNIELTSFWLILFSKNFGKRVYFVVPVFTLIEGCIYGFGIWWVSYLYIWFILWGIVMLIPRRPLPETSRSYALHSFGWALLSGVYGFSFGALTAIPWLITGGPKTALAYWLSGIVFDVPHAIGNFVAALVLALPLMAVLTRLRSKLHTN